MITNWLPGITRHKNIVSPTLPSLSNGAKYVLVLIEKAYRILGPDQLDPSTRLTMIPPPDVLIRLMVCPLHVREAIELKDRYCLEEYLIPR